MNDTRAVDYVPVADGSLVPRTVANVLAIMTPAVAQDTLSRAFTGESVSGDELSAARIFESDIIYMRVMGVISQIPGVTVEDLGYLGGQITAAMGADLDQ